MSRGRKYPEELMDRGVRLAIESGRPVSAGRRGSRGAARSAAQARASGGGQRWQALATFVHRGAGGDQQLRRENSGAAAGE